MSDTPKVPRMSDERLELLTRLFEAGSPFGHLATPHHQIDALVRAGSECLVEIREARAERDRLQCQVIEMQKRLGVERTDYEMALEDLRHRIVNTAKELRAHLGKEAKDDRA